jgi:large subunit ribosomal protein L29
MTTKEMREKATDHLGQELLERRKHMFDLRSQAVTEKLEDPSQLRKTRLDIARLKTILRQRELEAAGGAASGAPAAAKPAAASAAKKRTAPRKMAAKKTVKRTTKTKAAKA